MSSLPVEMPGAPIADFQSQSISKLAIALAKAQAEIDTATKENVNPHFHSRYADLASVWGAWQKVGPKHGLAVVQVPQSLGGESVLVSQLMHESGEWIRSVYPLRPVKQNDPQAMGSALTYARRYCLAALVGVAPEDDDGNAASAGRPEGKPEPEPRRSDDGYVKSSANKFPADCHRCGFHVPAEAGLRTKVGEGWQITHATEKDCEAAGQPDARDNEKQWHSEIQLVIAQAGLSTTAAKPRRLELLRECFGTDSWKGVTAMPTDDLKQGLAKLKVALGRNEALAPAD